MAERITPFPIPKEEHPHLYRTDFSNITDPKSGEQDWLIDGIAGKGELVMIAAAWKTAKTLISYEMTLNCLNGKNVFGRFAVEKPLKVMVFQLEMPTTEDNRRFRRLSIGSALDPQQIHELHQTGQFIHYGFPSMLDLGSEEGRKSLHRAVLQHVPDLVIIDSALAAFCSIDLNDNSLVRKHFMMAFMPLLAQGITVVVLHHFRKANGDGTNKSSVLGAQAFGATSGRVYSLERLASDGNNFTLRLACLGSWAPGMGEDIILRVEDTPDGHGTTVRAIEKKDLGKKVKMTKEMIAALHVKDLLVREGGRLAQPNAIAMTKAECGISERTIEAGIFYGKIKGWYAKDEDVPANQAAVLILIAQDDPSESVD